MKIIVISIVAGLLGLATAAQAACPAGTVYNCIQMPNGKMSCGCR